MTPEEAQACLGKVIKIQAVGLGKGFKNVELFKFDPNEKCPWGKGSVKYVDLEDPKQRTVSCCLTQINLYKERKRKRRDSNGKLESEQSFSISTQSSDTDTSSRKRKRKSKTKRRRRS